MRPGDRPSVETVVQKVALVTYVEYGLVSILFLSHFSNGSSVESFESIRYRFENGGVGFLCRFTSLKN